MNTKLASFVLALALAATACMLPGQFGLVAQVPDISLTPTQAAPTFTQTAKASFTPTHTVTAAPPTETDTPLPPTPTEVITIARVVGVDIAYVRSGPCNHPRLIDVLPGMEFPVTGQYVSPNQATWWRIQFTSGSGIPEEGWIWGGRVEVTGEMAVPAVVEHCPPFPTDTPEATNTPELPLCQTKTLTTSDTWARTFRPTLWATHIRGDREFAGNGPSVKVAAYLYTSDHEIKYRITMQAEETVYDFTTGVGDTDLINLFRAPDGWRIKKLSLNQFDATAGAYYSEWSYIDDDTDLDIYAPQDGGPVARFEVFGDTPGDDFGAWTGTAGTSFVRISFHTFDIELVQEGNCR